MKRRIANGLIMLAASATLCMTGSPDASAQPWFQSVYGSTKNEVGRSVLQTSSDGGYITAGYSNSFSTQYDVYIVKTNTSGGLMWSQVFDIGGDDYGTSIVEVPGGYVVTGYTQNKKGCCSKDDIFVMKIDFNGVHQWTRIYGGDQEDQAYEVRTTTDDGLIVAGWTRSFGQGNREGFLFKTDLNGVVIWSRVFGGTLDDYFHSVTLTSDLGFAAAGTSHSFLQPGRTDAQAWVVKVDANGALLWSRVYGGTAADGIRSIREVNPTDLVFVGNTNSVGAGSSDILLVKTTNLGAVIGARTFGTAGYDEGTSVKEVQSTPGHLGNYILTGFQYNGLGFGSGDVYFAEVQPNATLTPVSRRQMGGTGDDWGWAINEDRFGVPGIDYIITGRTTSAFLTPVNPEDEYLLTVNPVAPRTCQERAVTDVTSTVSVISTSITPSVTTAMVSCSTSAAPITHITSQADPCPPSLSAPAQGDGGTSGVDLRPWENSDPATIGLDASNALNSYPNPVERGSTFLLEYVATPDARADITIIDVAGQVVHREVARSAAGLGRVPVATEGWSNGVYLVQVVVGDMKLTRQIVVADK